MQITKASHNQLQQNTGDNNSRDVLCDCADGQRLRSIGMEVMRVLCKKCPEYNSMLVTGAERFHDTRKTHLLQLHKYRTITYGERSFKYSMARIRDELDNKYKQDLDKQDLDFFFES